MLLSKSRVKKYRELFVSSKGNGNSNQNWNFNIGVLTSQTPGKGFFFTHSLFIEIWTQDSEILVKCSFHYEKILLFEPEMFIIFCKKLFVHCKPVCRKLNFYIFEQSHCRDDFSSSKELHYHVHLVKKWFLAIKLL